MQIRMRDMAREAATAKQAIPDQYWAYLRLWIALGVIARDRFARVQRLPVFGLGLNRKGVR
jgi:uncharacterized membrane protein